MANFKAWWYRLVAGGLLRQLGEQIAATKSNALSWAAADQVADDLRKEVNELRRQVPMLKSELKYAQESRTADAAATAQIVRERMGMDADLPGKMDLLRQQLKQELAYVAYLEEIKEHYAGDQPSFNALPLEERQRYFEQVEGQVR
ncbi:MAG: hypothetical protein K5880_14180 [Hydrogenophaga sp.]|uniref:hypothetical protein n=1 Tax=Hydrogenophaga sp. TaxID=1904254 RepID=UPI002612CC38|nr:hypothetical protein [Hydrogenophaga sp.]MCV0439771.1 hypothetical protein [Hydrogenophaga sp.]